MEEYLDALLPPNWHLHEDGKTYFNEVTQDETEENPFQQYLKIRDRILCDRELMWGKFLNPQRHTSKNQEQLVQKSGIDGANCIGDSETMEVPEMKTSNQGSNSTGQVKHLEYYCKWNDRDAFGKNTVHSLTIRYYDGEDRKTMVRIDGMDAQWTFSALEGPYGAIGKHDLYIGAKITIFGSHMTISGANSIACKWIAKEAKRLEKQQAHFQGQIESVGQMPAVRRQHYKEVLRHVDRESKSQGQRNLRKLLNENAKLGEQLADLGLARQLA